jgi:hypothetical protein
MPWPVGKKKTPEQVETCRRAQLRRFGTDPDALLKCSFCRRSLPDDAFARNPAVPPNRRGRNYLCKPCKRQYDRAGRPRRPIAKVGPDRYRCARCKRIFPGSEYRWRARKDRGGHMERSSYCRPCEVRVTQSWQGKPHPPETEAKLKASRQRSHKKAAEKAKRERVERTRWVAEQTQRLLSLGWTVTDLGRQLGVQRGAVAKWRDGKTGSGVFRSTEERLGDLLLRIANGEAVPVDRRRKAA